MAVLILRLNSDHALLGKKWISNFMQRNPEVFICIGRSIEASRIDGSHTDLLCEFYTRFRELQSPYNVEQRNIWNMDEHGISLGVCANSMVLASSDPSDISGWLGDSFQEWTVDDFNSCAYNNLTQLRKTLRDKGVYVDTGRPKPEVIKALMAALPEKRDENRILANIIPQKANFQPLQPQQKRKLNTEEAETTNQIQPLFNSSLPPRNPFEASSISESQKKPNRTKPNFSLSQTTSSSHTSYGREMGLLLKFYINDEHKYSGRPNDSISFKYGVFLDNCSRASLPRFAYRDAIPSMFTGSALRRYFATCKHIDSHEERNMSRKWHTCTLSRFIKDNSGKSLTDCLRLMIEYLEEMQFCLSEEYRSELSMYNKLIEACRKEPACRLAVFRPSPWLQGLINDLHSSVATYEDIENTHGTNEVLVTDRRYYNPGNFHQRTPNNRTQPPLIPQSSSSKPENQKSRICYVCGAKGCWSNKHSESERHQSKKKFLARMNKKVDQFFGDGDTEQEPTYDLNDLEHEMETLALEAPFDITDETSDLRADHFMTSFGSVPAETALTMIADLQNHSRVVNKVMSYYGLGFGKFFFWDF
ncbi:hypothetical protein K3495_g13665 [Podosphaera aphanis]|nr:hypothetical protein K3495_g13665 [Podosphaera aphanis]